LCILTARRDGRLVGAVPIFLVRRMGRTWLSSLAFGTYGGPLFARDDTDPVEIRTALAKGMAEWFASEALAGGEFVNAPLGDEIEPYPEWREICRSVTTGYTHIIDLTRGSQTILEKLKRETKKGLRRAEKKGMVFEEAPGSLAAVHDLYVGQTQGWGTRHPYALDFLRALLDHPSGFARLYIARIEDRLQAGVLALSAAGETFLWWSGSAPESRQTLAYPYLLLQIMNCSEREGMKRLNIGSSGGNERIESFKESVGGAAKPVWVYHVKPNRVDPLTRLYELLRVLRRRV
jgi:hypothetical protein